MATPSPQLTVHHLQVGQGERIPWLLEELSIPYTLKIYHRSPFLSPPELVAKHPMGASPLLEDFTSNPTSPLLLAESGAIADYIIYKYGSGRLALAPSDEAYADYLYWFHFSNASLQPTCFRRFTARSVASDAENPRVKMAEERVERVLKHMDERLSSNTWLAGTEFTAADVMTLFTLTTMRKFDPINLTGYEGILGWMKRCTERPAYQTAMEKCDPELLKEREALISAAGPGKFVPKM
jgi:glutathione S-transferase